MPGESGFIIENLPGVIDALAGIKERASVAGEAIVTEAGRVVEDAAKRNWRPRPSGSVRVSKRTGRTYYDGDSPFQAERPYPTQRSGNTRNSIKVKEVAHVGDGAWQALVGPETEYSAYVEFGTEYIHSPAFPFMTKALQDSEVAIIRIYQEGWAKALGGE